MINLFIEMSSVRKHTLIHLNIEWDIWTVVCTVLYYNGKSTLGGILCAQYEANLLLLHHFIAQGCPFIL